jgi:hypothetical protein
MTIMARQKWATFSSAKKIPNAQAMVIPRFFEVTASLGI